MLPTFLIIGAGKSGTTSLWTYLNQHPQIGMSAIKEPSFFSVDEVYARGLSWYEKLYSNCEGSIARGEASNSYSATMTFPHTVDRIAEALDSPKFIYIVRHPRHRTESDWMQMSKIKSISFHDFLHSNQLYADKNAYLRTYRLYAERFGEDRLLTLFYEDLVSDAPALLRRLTAFIGVDPSFHFETETLHGQSAEHRVFPPLFSRLRASRVYYDLSLRLPGRVKSALRSTFSRKRSVERPVWSDSDYSWFRDRFEAESREFLEAVGKDRNHWQW